VAAPFNTIDLATGSGKDIPIEERSAREVTHVRGVQVTPDGVGIANPAFDVTPAKYISAIITERGVLRAPFGTSIAALATPAGEQQLTTA
jgi:methylthioribose-1-phosphate isomerase